MPVADVRPRYEDARDRYREAVKTLAPLLVQMATETVVGALPDASVVDVLGGMNEDGAYTLRIQQVRDRTGRAIYDPQAPSEPAAELAMEKRRWTT